MTQAIPSTLLYAQALVMLKEMQENYTAGTIQSVDDISHNLRALLTRFEESAGSPFLKFEPVVEGEPPLSSKMNRTWHYLESDVNILQDQVDVLRASAIFTHNLITTEVLKSEQENARVDNKLKTLQLYSTNADANIISFGDAFRNDESVDFSLSSEAERPFVGQGVLHLGQNGPLKNLSQNSKITVLPNSNGFAGNNQEIEDPNTAIADPNTGDKAYVFVAESNRAADLRAITDGKPDKWFEYEQYSVSSQDKLTAGNFGFKYRVLDNDNVSFVDWSNGPPAGKLQLSLQFDLQSVQRINYVSYMPYGLRNNINYPIHVNRIQLSTDGTDWTTVEPQNVWVGTDPNLAAARTADNVTTGTAVWPFSEEFAQFVRVDLEQSQPVNANIGHLAYYNTDTNARMEGPLPPVTNPAVYYDPQSVHSVGQIQKREFFVGKRWAIGIRDLLIQQVKYQPKSVMVTKPLRVGGLVDRVSLQADIFTPDDFPRDQSWVEFFVSPNDGAEWFQISRIQDDYLAIPEVIAFNDPLPEVFHEPGVAYYQTTNPVTQLRLKAILTRPDDLTWSTPVVREYELKVRRR